MIHNLTSAKHFAQGPAGSIGVWSGVCGGPASQGFGLMRGSSVGWTHVCMKIPATPEALWLPSCAGCSPP